MTTINRRAFLTGVVACVLAPDAVPEPDAYVSLADFETYRATLDRWVGKHAALGFTYGRREL